MGAGIKDSSCHFVLMATFARAARQQIPTDFKLDTPMKRRFLTLLASTASVFALANITGAQDAPKPAEPTPAPSSKVVKVALETSKGTIELELDAEKAPLSTANFVNYVKKGHYDGTIFHRVIPNFMIQGGGFNSDMTQKATDAPIQNESKNGLKNVKGSIAMARTSAPNSATSQFFINVQDNANLDYPSFDGFGYAVFGKVSKGLDVVEAIKAVETTSKGGHQNVPAEPVVIKSAKVLE